MSAFKIKVKREVINFEVKPNDFDIMQQAFLNISSVPTHIVSWGPWVEKSFLKKEVVIGIPGSPGLTGFYTDFMSTIHQNIDPDIPVWLIGK